MKMLSLIFGIIATLIVGCTADKSVPQPGNESIELSKSDQAVANATTDFGFDLMDRLHAEEPDENQVISPVSVSLALGMLYNGTDGITRDELKAGLRLDNMSENQINDYYEKMITKLPMLDDKVDLSIANAVYHHDQFSPKQDFLTVVNDKFHSSINALDFRDPQSPGVINQWVSDQTNGKIDEMINDISRESVMFLLNALYFKGQWMKPFDKDETAEGTFTKADGSQYEVPFMEMEQHWSTWSGEVFMAVDLPYGDSVYSMTLVLPDKTENMGALINQMDSEWIKQLSGNLSLQKSNLKVPKFQLTYEAALKPVLSAMGMESMFSEKDANLQGISDDARLFVRDVKHKTFIEVNEEGTEAAAATSVDIGVTSLPPTISFDRPFLFLIRENQTNTVVFAGKVMQP